MNSADKTIGWDNGQVPHPNGLGGVQTDTSLDPVVGTGRMNLDQAYDQLLAGTTDVPGSDAGNQGLVEPTGWDHGRTAENETTDYLINRILEEGTNFTATLTWFRDRQVFDTGAGFAFIDDNYSDLDLEIWTVENGSLDELISLSDSTFNNSEHLSFAIPHTGQYAIRVRWFQEIFDRGAVQDPNETFYGLAWAGSSSGQPIPEPASIALVLISATAVGVARRRRRQAA